MDSNKRPKKHEHPWKLHRRVKRHTKGKRAERARIMQQIKALRAVLPNNQKPDVVSVLGEAIEYMKYLQSQLDATFMRCSLHDGASTVGLQCVQHPQLGPGGPLGEPISLGTNQGPCSVNGCPGVGCYSSVPLLHPSTAHHYVSRTSTLPCEFCSVLADAWAWPQHPLVPDQKAEALEDTTATSASDESS